MWLDGDFTEKNGDSWMIYLLKMVIVHSYVNFPEATIFGSKMRSRCFFCFRESQILNQPVLAMFPIESNFIPTVPLQSHIQ